MVLIIHWNKDPKSKLCNFPDIDRKQKCYTVLFSMQGNATQTKFTMWHKQSGINLMWRLTNYFRSTVCVFVYWAHQKCEINTNFPLRARVQAKGAQRTREPSQERNKNEKSKRNHQNALLLVFLRIGEYCQENTCNQSVFEEIEALLGIGRITRSLPDHTLWFVIERLSDGCSIHQRLIQITHT